MRELANETQKETKKKRQKKYFGNPEPNWGPKPRAVG